MSDFRKELDDVAAAFEAQETALADSRARVVVLERKLAEAGVGDADPVEPPPFETDLEIFDTVDEIEWKRWPVSELHRFPELAQRVQMNFYPKAVRESGEFMPVRNVIVRQYGELTNVEMRRISGVQADYDLICHRRCVDVTARFKVAIVQSGDGAFEADVTDIEFLCKNYQGGLLQPLSSWREDYQRYAKILAQARPDLVGEWEASRFDLSPVPR